MPKKPPGVYKRGGTWSVVIEHGRDPQTGKRKRVWHSGFSMLGDAVEARTRLLRERDTGAAIDPSKQTLAQFLRDEWLPSREPQDELVAKQVDLAAGEAAELDELEWHLRRIPPQPGTVMPTHLGNVLGAASSAFASGTG